MINYDNGHQFAIIFQKVGSVLPQCLPIGFVTFSTGLALSILRYHEQDKPERDRVVFSRDTYIHDPFCIQIIALVVGFLIVQRTNMALSRWMEGVEDIQTMLSKWSDAFDALNAFFSGKAGTQEQLQEILMFRIRVAHWFSLMSCLAFATLRNRGELGMLEQVPIKELLTAAHLRRQAKSFAVARLQTSMRQSRKVEISQVSSTVYSDGTEWAKTGGDGDNMRKSERHFQSLSSRATYESLADSECPATRPNPQGSFFSRLTSQPIEPPKLMDGIDLMVLSIPTPEEVKALEQSHDKPNTICLWIIQGVILMTRKKLLDIPPPILSRIFQELSNGMLGFNQAHKVALVPFPFPFAQMVSLLLLIFYLCIPFFVDIFTQNIVVTPVLSFVLPVTYCALNSIAVELEQPFGVDDNDIDIEARHEDFLWLMIDVLRAPKMCPVDETHDLEDQIIRGIIRDVDGVAPELEPFRGKKGRKKTNGSSVVSTTPSDVESYRGASVISQADQFRIGSKGTNVQERTGSRGGASTTSSGFQEKDGSRSGPLRGVVPVQYGSGSSTIASA
mmetsp:Transcript_36243/g.63855  ORF Transcript_36243/g.63855 Transcript_36243/m.63855 type:complete len:560 (-) Transcript_36243:144-1823(-)